MNEILGSVLSSDKFIPNGHCYLWKPGLVWFHVIADSLVRLSYFIIPFTVVYFIRKRKDIPFNWMLMAFAIFIVPLWDNTLDGSLDNVESLILAIRSREICYCYSFSHYRYLTHSYHASRTYDTKSSTTDQSK